MGVITNMTDHILTAVGVPRVVDRPLDGWHMNVDKPEIGMILTYPPTYTQPPGNNVPRQMLAFKPSLLGNGELLEIWASEYIVQLGDPDSWTNYFELHDRQDILPWGRSTTKVIKVLGHHIGQGDRLILRIQYEGGHEGNAGNVDEVWMRSFHPQLLREYWLRYRTASFKARWAARRAGEHGPQPATDEWWKRAPSNVKHGNLRYRNWLNVLSVRPSRLPRIRVRDQIAGFFGRWADAETIPPR
ncbi:hypothetical protein BDP81DRAFT_407769 [Colletotrichum phormii]|uniref:Uncharacterized protein n=1 Tax=Colletotrichum phormii TaxID=359342 RepID=A0AAJ0EFT7_9PEZI|nr:uncharacterized protein BDP81DRAFT_407769 [Colletotrichum phormii]KAK1635396.1 hypothetical protein BDP81DRAFT_407769 [Colletotrichum phormii]